MATPGQSFLAARTRSAPQGFGRPIPRKEDARLVTGRGRFSDDFSLPGQAHAHLIRSPHAHARVLSIEAAAALAMPGVLAVLTGRDAAADGLASIPHKPVPTNAAAWLPSELIEQAVDIGTTERPSLPGIK